MNQGELPGAVQFQYVLRPFSSLTTTTALLPSHSAPTTGDFDSHISWLNAVNGVFNQAFADTYPADNMQALQAYAGELLGVYTDGSLRVVRYAKNRSTYMGDFNDSPDAKSTRTVIGRKNALLDTRPAERNGDDLPGENLRAPAPKQALGGSRVAGSALRSSSALAASRSCSSARSRGSVVAKK